jgi:hypothetical protein
MSDNTKLDTNNPKCILFTNARDEKRIVEWVLHHQHFGFDHIYIIDHLSKTPITQTLCKCLYQYDNITVQRNTDIKAIKMKFNQQAIVYSKKQGYDWLLYLDADEFLYIKDHDSIHEFIKSYPNDTAKIGINWLMFGSNNKDTFNSECTIFEEFTRSSNKLAKNIKSLVRVGWMARDKIPHPHTYFCQNKNGKIYDIKRNRYSLGKQLTVGSALIPNAINININEAESFIAHYSTQDYQTLLERKINRRRDDILNQKRTKINIEQCHSLNNDIDNFLMRDMYNKNLRDRLSQLESVNE